MAFRPTRTNTDDYIYQVENVRRRVKVRSATDGLIRRSPGKGYGLSVKSYVDKIRSIFSSYRELAGIINVPSVPASALSL